MPQPERLVVFCLGRSDYDLISELPQGVFSTLEAAQGRAPDVVTWEQDEAHPSYWKGLGPKEPLGDRGLWEICAYVVDHPEEPA